MSIVEKYKELEVLLHKNEDEKIEELFKDILNEAINVINEKFEKNEFLDVTNPTDKAVIRAMFEYMLELWAEGAIDEAKQLGYDMLYLVKDEKLKEMFSMFVIGMLEGLSVDKFFEKYVDSSKTYENDFFVDFKDEIDSLIIKHKKQFQKEYSKDAE